MAYYWAIKENKLLIHALTWVNLKIIILSEGTQAKKGKKKKKKEKELLVYYSMYIYISRKCKLISETGSR